MKESLLLLPGMMCDERLFAPQINAFSDQYDVHIPPLFGQNSIGSIASAILASASTQFALAGLSLGGIVAMEIMRQAPERVTRLALLDTNPLNEEQDRQQLRDKQIERVKQGELRTIMRDEMKPNYLADNANKNDILELCMDMAEYLGEQVFIDQSLALKNRIDQCETLSQVQIPTMIIRGIEDQLCSLEKHQRMQSLITGSEFIQIEQAGHLPTLEQPELCNQALQQWLAMR